jgi:hypothetical protein
VPQFAQVTHHEWIAAPVTRVRRQFADLRHHIYATVHPKLHFEILQTGPCSARYVQDMRLLGVRQRDVFERRIGAGGSIRDTSVEGFKASSLAARCSFVFSPSGARGATARTWRSPCACR